MFYIFDTISNGRDIVFMQRGSKPVLIERLTECQIAEQYHTSGYGYAISYALATGGLNDIVTAAYMAKSAGLINSRSVTIIEARTAGLIV
jgi:hypothetical protein